MKETEPESTAPKLRRPKNAPQPPTDGFTEEEKAAMKARVQELKTEKRSRSGAAKADGEGDVIAVIAALPQPSRTMAERLHALIKASAPSLTPKTWYGMPAYANSDGKIVCFFRSAEKFKERYMTLGFNESARLDEGNMWPVAFALTDLTPAEEERIASLVGRAAG